MNDKWKSQCALDVLKQRAFLLAQIRQYFANNGVLEVETPILSSAGNTDINIESFTSEAINSDHAKSYLRTSPEFALKRLLCSGMGDIFELAKVFRKSEISSTHNIEFTMLEWYRLNFSYLDLIQDVTLFFKTIFGLFKLPDAGTDMLTFYQCFERFLDINIKTITLDKLNNTCNTYGYSGSLLSRDQASDFLFATQIQPLFDDEALTFITHYPATQAALAEINPDDASVALRFEVFYQGHELGNGYQELTNADELLQRFKQDNLMRIKNNQMPINIDKNLLLAMQNEMPSCSGIAIGVDRLMMVLLGCCSINEVITFNAFNS